MTAETKTLVRFLDAADLIASEAPRPTDAADAAEVLAAVHPLMDTTEALHDQIAGCYGPIDHKGRCTDCGRLVVKAHKERGCMTAVPFLGGVLWLLDNPESIPFFGKRIWLRRKLSSVEAGTPQASTDGSAGSHPRAESAPSGERDR